MATLLGPRKINLGCGPKLIPNWVNVDLHMKYGREFFDSYKTFDDTRFECIDLSKTPWPLQDNFYEHLMALDFLEHFPYRQTEAILQEMWRIMKVGGIIELQVPDFEECSAAATKEPPFFCHVCGYNFNGPTFTEAEKLGCPRCETSQHLITKAAIERLYGGQDFEGNWHYNAFTKSYLQELMQRSGFDQFSFVETNQNGETFAQNWNFKIQARKTDGW